MFRQQSGYRRPVESAPGASRQPERCPPQPADPQAVRHHPHDTAGKVLLPSLASNEVKRRGSGQRVSFSICQSLKVRSVYIAVFFTISLYCLACRAFKKQNKHFLHFVLAALKVLLLYCQLRNFCICACVCTWTLTYCRIFASHFTLFNLVC